MATDNIAIQFVTTTPPITRVLVALTIIVSVSTFLNFIGPQQLSYSRFYLWEWQFHRIFTTFFYYGKTNFELIMNFIFLYKYSSMLEESYGKKSDYFFVLLVVFVVLFITSNVMYIPFLATALSNTITYIWARKNPQGIVQIFGFVSFNAFYLPFIFPIISLIFEGRVSKDEILGIAVGQIVFYLKDVYPKFGRDLLKTPCWCHKLFGEKGPCCEPKEVGTAMRKKVSDFARSQGNISEAISGKTMPEKLTESHKDEKEDHSTEYAAPPREDGKLESQDVLDDGQCLDYLDDDDFDSRSIDEEDSQDINGIYVDSEFASVENQKPWDRKLENPVDQSILSDSGPELPSSDHFELGNGIDQGDEESFNSEEICDTFEDISDVEDAKSHDLKRSPEISEDSRDNNNSSQGENSWESE